MHLKAVNLLLSVIFAILLIGCSDVEKGPEPVEISGPTMGTTFHVKYFLADVSSARHTEIRSGVEETLERVNSLMSTYRKDSELSRFNRTVINEWFTVSEETAAVIGLAQQISEKTGGAFDITVASLVNLWGFGPDPSKNEPPPVQAIEAELAKTGYRFVEVRQTPASVKKSSDITLDLSAIAKGYAVDLVAELLDQAGVESYMVEVGGEIRARGLKPEQQPWRIAVESPVTGQRSVHRVIELTDIAIATSGDYRNYFEQDGVRYSHTIDPVTGYPISHSLASVTVLAKTSAEADALATALSVMGPERALSFANANQVPALLIVKAESGFTELASDEMVSWLNE